LLTAFSPEPYEIHVQFAGVTDSFATNNLMALDAVRASRGLSRRATEACTIIGTDDIGMADRRMAAVVAVRTDTKRGRR
jgi:hypothetical protein